MIELGELIIEAYEALTPAQAVAGGVFVTGGTALTMGTMHRAGMNSSAPRDATFVNNGSVHEKRTIINSAAGKENGPPNPDGAKGKADHQEKVKELAQKAQSEHPNDQVVSERKIRLDGSNRRPDVQVVDKQSGKTKKVYEAERKPNSSRNQKREAEYDKLGIDHETHKVGGN